MSQPMTGAAKDKRIDALNRSGGFNRVNGIVILDWQDGMALLRVDLTADHLNPLGLVHGGLYNSMLDVALAMCGSFRPEPDNLYPGLTLSLTTQYLSAMRLDDGFATARARRIGAGRSLFFAEGEIMAPNDRLVASASGVFKPGRPPSA